MIGVQTCALPILGVTGRVSAVLAFLDDIGVGIQATSAGVVEKEPQRIGISKKTAASRKRNREDEEILLMHM